MNEPGDEPISLINYDKMGYYSSIKKPDEVFELDVSENLLCTFLKEKTHIGNGDIINLLLHNGIWIKVKIGRFISKCKNFFADITFKNNCLNFCSTVTEL